MDLEKFAEELTGTGVLSLGERLLAVWGASPAGSFVPCRLILTSRRLVMLDQDGVVHHRWTPRDGWDLPLSEIGLVRTLKPRFGKAEPNLEITGRLLIVWDLGLGELHTNPQAVCEAIVRARDYGT